MGDSDEEADEDEVADSLMSDVETVRAESSMMRTESDSGFASMMSFNDNAPSFEASTSSRRESVHPRAGGSSSAKSRSRHSAPPVLNTLGPSSFLKSDYKLLHQNSCPTSQPCFNPLIPTLCTADTRGAYKCSHQHYLLFATLHLPFHRRPSSVYPGSRDKTVREWNLSTGLVERVVGEHSSSVLSICVYNGLLASAGSDRRVVVWDLEKNELVKVISDHEDSVLCVRFDDARLVSCSKGLFTFSVF